MPNLVFGMQPFPLNSKKKLKVAGLYRPVTCCTFTSRIVWGLPALNAFSFRQGKKQSGKKGPRLFTVTDLKPCHELPTPCAVEVRKMVP